MLLFTTLLLITFLLLLAFMLLLQSVMFLLSLLQPTQLLPMFYSSCQVLLLASLPNDGFSTAAAVISDVNGVHVVVGLLACCCWLYFFC
jgi:hypothetical protein